MNLAPFISRAGATALIAAALVASGCGGKTHTSAIPAGGGAASSTPTTTAPQAPKGPSRVPPAPGEAKLGKKPPIGRPTGTPPTSLKIRDIVKGRVVTTVPESRIVETLIEEALKLAADAGLDVSPALAG